MIAYNFKEAMRATKKQAKGKILGTANIQRRKQKGEYRTLVKETMLFDQEYFFPNVQNDS